MATLDGGEGEDWLIGGEGGDSLDGGKGEDWLICGGGRRRRIRRRTRARHRC